MIQVSNVSLRYGKRVLFDEVNLKMNKGTCYGIIGANGAGKSTLLKIMSGEMDAQTGKIDISPGMRMSVLSQNHFEFDEHTVLNTVLIGNKVLWNIMQEKDAIYAKPDFSDEDGLKVGDLEAQFGEMNGWTAESDAAELLSNLGIKEDLHYKLMNELNPSEKVRVLLAQALFGNPDILMMDEPTNGLDIETIAWLENFLADFENIAIVVSHDRHFLDMVCTHMIDIDYSKVNIYTGNYTFWFETSQMLNRQKAQKNKKMEDKKAELLEFIARFSANASKSKQATSRKKALEKLDFETIQASSRKYPGIIFKQEREAGNQVLEVDKLCSKNAEGEVLFKDITFQVNKDDKIAIISKDPLAINAFFEIVSNNKTADAGTFEWGITIKTAYIPYDNSAYFDGLEMNLIDWLRQYSTGDKDEQFIRGFLGKMLFSGDEVLKMCNVLSGGEKVRCMLSRMMLQEANLLLLDDPTNHLDLESITALNNSLKDFAGTILFSSHDHEFLQTSANRIIELTPNGCLDKLMTYDEYLADEKVKTQRAEMYGLLSSSK
jgi:ATPase subunit of ABC transporter with duplicated ATPase domains